MNMYILDDKDKEIIEGLKTRVETLLAEVVSFAKKLDLEEKDNGRI